MKGIYAVKDGRRPSFSFALGGSPPVNPRKLVPRFRGTPVAPLSVNPRATMSRGEPRSAPKPPPPPEIIGAFDDRRDAHSDATPHGAECDVPLWRNMKMYIELPRRPIYDGGEQGAWGWRGVSRAVRGGPGFPAAKSGGGSRVGDPQIPSLRDTIKKAG